MDRSRVTRTKLGLVVRIGDTEVQAVAASTNFALNRIPQGQVSVPLGRNARTLEESIAHSLALSNNEMVPVQVFLRPSGQWSSADTALFLDFPGVGRWDLAGEQVIFDGYVTGTAITQQRGTIRYTLFLTHWLSDLNFSSALSNESHPGNPTRFRWRAVFGEDGAQNTAKTNFVQDHWDSTRFTSGNIQADFWAKALQPFLCNISKRDVLGSQGGTGCDSLRDATNAEALSALARFEIKKSATEVQGPDCVTGSSSPYYKALHMKLESAPGVIAESIGTDCNHRTVDSYFSTTLWDKLVGDLGPTYYFSLVPRVNTAQIAPFVPGLRTTFATEFQNGKDLDFRDMVHFDANAMIQRPLRAVGILQSAASSRNAAGEVVPRLAFGGCFAVKEMKKGLVMYKASPSWLAASPYHGQDAGRTAWARKVGSATTPETPGQSVGDKDGNTPMKITNEITGYQQRVAQYMFAQEMLRGRNAVVHGKLRFDLAPGTTVRLRNTRTLFQAADSLAGDFFASITRVGIALDAETPTAGTAFQLEYLRSEAENNDERTSVDKHPLYDTIYTGASLVDAYLFPE